MNKKILAAAALALVSGAAMADAQLYGILDISAANVTNAGGTAGTGVGGAAGMGTPAGTTTGMTDGVWLPSLWGMKGSEDLGNGMKAHFDLQSNLITVSGNSGQTGGQLFDRYADVGVSGSFGDITVGNQIDPLFLESFLNGVRQAHSASLAVNGQLAYGAAQNNTAQVIDTRVNNLAMWKSPVYSNTTISLGYQFGNTAGNNTANSSQIAQVDYNANGLNLNAGYETTNPNTVNGTVASGTNYATTAGKLKKWVLGGTYTVGQVKLAAQANSFKNSAPTLATGAINAVGYEVGAAYSFTPSLTAAVNYVWVNDSVTNQTPTDASASLKYTLSKRTSIWALYSRADAKGTSGGALGWDAVYGQNTTFANTAGGIQNALAIGMTHTF